MSRSIAVLLVALAGAAAASAQAIRVLEPVERSVELALREVTLPAAGRRAVLYRPCATCPLETHSVTDKTTYLFNDRVLPLAQFLAEVEEVRQRPAEEARAVAFVYYDINTEDVNRVRVHASGR